VQRALEAQGVTSGSAEISMVPRSTIPLDAKEAERTLRLLDSLEELPDVQKAYTNADFPPEVLQKYREAP
jgi:transcriptional/translational regulatory protein YebC/TACO1